MERSSDPNQVLASTGAVKYALEQIHQEPGGFEPSHTTFPWG